MEMYPKIQKKMKFIKLIDLWMAVQVEKIHMCVFINFTYMKGMLKHF